MAISRLGTMAVGAWMNRIALPVSRDSTSMASRYLCEGASPMMSTGLPRDQLAGSTWSRRVSVASSSLARGTPSAAASSAAITPAPPPLVSTISWLDRPSRKRARVSAARNRSCRVSTRSMPERAMAASNTASDPARAPVCEAAAA